MPLYTGTHCLICYKKDSNPVPVDGDASARKRLQNSEICRRFCTLASRYLDLDPFHFHPLKTIKTKQIICYEHVCDSCVHLLEEFSNLCYQREFIKMQLSWRAHEIAQVMTRADAEEEGLAQRKILEQKLTEMGTNMEEIDDFRKDFVKSIAQRRKNENPVLKLRRSKTSFENSDEDPDFIPVKVSKEEYQKMIAERARDLNNSGTEVKTDNVQLSSKDFDGRSAISDRKRHIPAGDTTVAKETEEKRSKLSLTTIKKKRGRKSKAKLSDVSPAKFPHETKVIAENEDDFSNMKDCSESVKSESIYSEKTLIMSTISNASSCVCKNDDNEIAQHEDVSFDGMEVPKSTNEDPEVEYFEQWLLATMNSFSEDNSLDKLKKLNSDTTYYKQFEHLKYSCPYPQCDCMFNTMTRMLVHQQATGHNCNAVINIIMKR